MTNILPKDGELFFIPNFYNESQSEHFMDVLTDKIKWQQENIKMFGNSIPLPRLTSWYSLGGLSYSYSGMKMLPNKIDFTELNLIHGAVQLQTGTNFNSLLCNLYRDGKDSVSWHQDNEPELGIDPIIASLTFGATRTFKLRHKSEKGLNLDLQLTPGSLVIMGKGVQKYWEHSVPKSARVNEPRINLTFRNIQAN